MSVGRLLKLETWLGDDFAAEYRSRRWRGTRLPIDWRDYGDFRMLGFGVILFCVATGVALALLAESDGWMTFWGVAVGVALTAGCVAAVRYIRLPVDEEWDTRSRGRQA